jgi:3-phenylpropionate/cinnamic acid dioxygenase small subunit
MARDDAVLNDVLQRLRLLEDERAILRTLSLYAHYLDSGRDDDWLDLFTDDAVLNVRRRVAGSASQPHRHTGKEELRKFVTEHSKMAAPPASYDKHLYSSPLLTVDGDEARVEQYAAGLDDDPSGPSLGRFGRTFDHLVRQGGRWRFKERIIVTDVAKQQRG